MESDGWNVTATPICFICAGSEAPVTTTCGDLIICPVCLTVYTVRSTGKLGIASSEECEQLPMWVRKEIAAGAQHFGKPS